MTRIQIAALGLFVLCATAVAAIAESTGVSVIVENKGPAVISNVNVHVTGNSYNIGTINPGQSRRIRVRPNGESHVEITLTDSTQKTHRVVADCYFEDRHYNGSITIDITDNNISRVEEALELSYF